MDNNSYKISFRLSGISTEQFAIIEDVEIVDNKITIETEVGFGVNIEVSGIECKFHIRYTSNGKVFILLKVACQFEVENDFFKQNPEATQFIVPVDLAKHLAVITVGTSRGILHTKTEGGFYNKFILPTINLQDLLNEDVIFEIPPVNHTNNS